MNILSFVIDMLAFIMIKLANMQKNLSISPRKRLKIMSWGEEESTKNEAIYLVKNTKTSKTITDNHSNFLQSIK